MPSGNSTPTQRQMLLMEQEEADNHNDTPMGSPTPKTGRDPRTSTTVPIGKKQKGDKTKSASGGQKN